MRSLENQGIVGLGRTMLLLGSVYFIVTLWNLNIQTITRPDEPRYAAAAREMIRSGDLIVPRFNGEPRVNKPIFFYWLASAAGVVGQTLGLDQVAAMRLGPILMGLLAAIGTLLLGSIWFGLRVGFFSAAILITTGEFHLLSREIVVDMTLTAFVVWAWFFFYTAEQRIERRVNAVAPLLGFYVCLGLGILTKGHMALVFVAAPLLTYLIWDRRLSDWKKLGMWWGIPLALAIGLFWYALISHRGFSFASIFQREIIQRVSAGKDHWYPIPFVFYVESLLGNFAPWSLLLPFAAVWSYRQWHAEDSKSRPGRMLLCAVVVPFIILGVIPTKRALYIFPQFPFIACWCALSWEYLLLKKEGAVSTRATNAVRVLGILFFVAACVIDGFLPAWGGQFSEQIALLVISLSIAVFSWLLAEDLRGGRRVMGGLRMVVIAVIGIIGFEAIVRPIVERQEDRVAFYQSVQRQLANNRVVIFGESSTEAVWYLDHTSETIEDVTRPVLRKSFFESPGTMALMNEEKLIQIPELRAAVEVGEPIQRGLKRYVLAWPKPNAILNPSIFEPVKTRKNRVRRIQLLPTYKIARG
jgi:4-amino-4-deoxy-L-arabinose transferase-like glycosyltransferase